MSTTRLQDEHGAFVPGPRARREPTGQGALSGLRFAVKDLIDVAGVITTGGNPDWAATHGPARRDAPVVQQLLAAGATLVGKTVTDELAFSLEGANAFHGTPRNPRAPDRLPGGSSSGSAVAVAAGLVDFALGTDTGGSVRVPASFCGVFGFRPTHGRLSLDGVLPFAPSYDTVGWFARSGAMLETVGRVLLGAPPAHASVTHPTHRFSLIEDAFDMADADGCACLKSLPQALGAEATLQDSITVFDGAPQAWLKAYQILQGAEIWQSLGDWIMQHRPRFGPSMAPRFASVAQIDQQDIAYWQAWRAQQTARLHRLLSSPANAPDQAMHIWVLPTTPGVALPKDTTSDALGDFYSTALAMTSIAGHAGLPQVTLPIADIDDVSADPRSRSPWRLPLGLSLIGPPGSDEVLLTLAARITIA